MNKYNKNWKDLQDEKQESFASALWNFFWFLVTIIFVIYCLPTLLDILAGLLL